MHHAASNFRNHLDSEERNGEMVTDTSERTEYYVVI